MDKKKSAGEATDEWPLRPENPARRALREIGVTHLKQLSRFSEKELLKMHGIGPKAIRLLREALAQRGWTFAPSDSARAASATTKRGTSIRGPGRKR